MDSQLTNAEIEEKQQLLQDYSPGIEALAILEKNQGRLDRAFDELWVDKNEPLTASFDPSKRPSLWQRTLKILRQEVCGDDGFRSLLNEYIKSPSDTALLTGLIISLVELTTLPINPAIATIIVLYILKIGLGIFCEYIEPADDGGK